MRNRFDYFTAGPKRRRKLPPFLLDTGGITSTGCQKRVFGSGENPRRGAIQSLFDELMAIRKDMMAESARSRHRLAAIDGQHQESARNLLHYIALRSRDIRPLQLQLSALGLSSLGRAETHVLVAIDAVAEVLRSFLSCSSEGLPPPSERAEFVDFALGERLLATHTERLLGPSAPERSVRIMVTMPSEAADNFSLVYNLLQQGMNCMRINCAHDDAAAWLRMIQYVKKAGHSLGRSCRIMMDLAGPKLRTGPLSSGPAVIRIQPQRDVYGRVIAPARIWLTPEHDPTLPPSPAAGTLPVPIDWLSQLNTGELIKLTDARGAKRRWVVVENLHKGFWVEADKTSYIEAGTVLQKSVGNKDDGRKAVIGELPPTDNPIYLKEDDLLIVSREPVLGHPAVYSPDGRLLSPAIIGCTLPEVFAAVQAGEAIWFDDGKIGGIIEKVENQHIIVRITQASIHGHKLAADKGINLPDSHLHLSAMTAKDLEDLSFVAQYADIVALSFVNSASDVELLQQHLAQLSDKQPALVLKIETKRGFENLPDILLMAMRSPCCGVMIARGDLAVECGFERLAEVQEEILWICEAAHVPVIWATQVLETLAKKGIPSRAEITDAAMGNRAECVMLNKGPFVVNAVRVLDDILRRMQGHQSKKRPMLRELRMAHMLAITDERGLP